jgi:glycosyltransferase involved in cell wall biosynthesis
MPLRGEPRVLWLTTEFFPPEMGGTGVITARLAAGLAERALNVQVVTRQTVPRSPRHERIGLVDVRRIRPAGRMKGVGWRAFPVMLAYVLHLAAFLVRARQRYDLVIIAGMKTIPLGAVPACRLLGKKCVIRIESPFEIAEPISAESLAMMNGLLGRLLSRTLMGAQRMLLRRADRVIAISNDISQRLRQLGYPQERIVEIPNTVDLTRFKPLDGSERDSLRARLHFPAGKTVLVYAGRLSRAKGVMMLMEIMPELFARHSELYLVVVGSGRESWDSCEEEVAEFVRARELGHRVALPGQSERLHEYLQAADLFVSPSDYEGFGLTTVEALACATPVVTTAVGIVPQVIEHGVNGFLCPPKDPRALNAALEEALDARSRWPQIGRLARESVVRFDLPQVISQYVTLCRDLN